MTIQLDFADFLRASIPGADVDIAGQDDGWVAPLGIVHAPGGFDEETWIDDQPDSVLTASLGGARAVCENPGFRGAHVDGGQRLLCLQPKGGQSHYWARGSISFAHFYVTDTLVARAAEGLNAPSFTAAELRRDLIMFPDETLWRLLSAYVERATDRNAPPSRLEMEARALLVVERLIGQHHLDRRPTLARGGLAPWQLRRTQEAMLARLDSSVSLEMLAEIAGCSPTHFSRAFKQSVGLPPFDWLAERRIDRAKELLETNRLSLAEVALAVGFAAQPQFTTAFGKATGLTPGRWRRERRR